MKAEPNAIADLIETVSLGSPRNAVGFMLWRVTHRYQREVDRVLRPQDLTHLQFIALALVGWLARDGAIVTQAQVARFGDIQPMQVSMLIKALVAKQLIHRAPAPQGGPAQAISVTPAGLAALAIALPMVIATQRAIFGKGGLPGGTLFAALEAIDGAEPGTD